MSRGNGLAAGLAHCINMDKAVNSFCISFCYLQWMMSLLFFCSVVGKINGKGEETIIDEHLNSGHRKLREICMNDLSTI